MMMAIRRRSGWRVGAWSLFVAVSLAAACGVDKHDASLSLDEKRGTPSSLDASSAPATNAVLEWNRIANEQLALAGLRLAFHTRILAITQAAVFDAVNAIDGKYAPYAVSPAAVRTSTVYGWVGKSVSMPPVPSCVATKRAARRTTTEARAPSPAGRRST
jgi:hypothetical protein